MKAVKIKGGHGQSFSDQPQNGPLDGSYDGPLGELSDGP